MPSLDPASLPIQRQQRNRRPRIEVETRLREAARALFGERGYAGATTKDIAKRASVSETLLFRYFGGKASLFDEVVSRPFNSLLQDFTVLHPNRSEMTAHAEDSAEFVNAVYNIFQDNRDVLRALLAAPTLAGSNRSEEFVGLEGYFDKSVQRLEERCLAEGGRLGIDPHVAVRLGFGMIAASVLLRDWLFPRGLPADGEMTDALRYMVEKTFALSPAEG